MIFEKPERILLQRSNIEQVVKHNKIVPPTTVDIELSYFCNHNCIWCYCKGFHRNEYLSLNIIDEIINYCIKNEVRWIILSGGGEPSTHPNFLNVINKIEKAKINYMIYTNGSKLNKFYNYLGDYCKNVRVSLDASNNETYKNVHGLSNNSFNKIIDSIIKLKESNSHIIIGLSFVISKMNNFEIGDFINLAEYLDVDEILFKANIYEDNINKDILKRSKFKTSHDKDISITDRTQSNNINYKFKRCYACELKMIILPDGTMPICCSRRSSQFIIGNVNQSHIHELWNSSQRRRIIKSIDTELCPLCRFTVSNYLVESHIINNDFIDVV
mgnify:CR=1 FL=1